MTWWLIWVGGRVVENYTERGKDGRVKMYLGDSSNYLMACDGYAVRWTTGYN